MKEIRDYEDAKSRITTLFKGSTSMRLKQQEDIDDFARIAWFLTNTKSVMPALEVVSSQIWDSYNLQTLKQSPNRFSKAIIQYGADAFGFAMQDNIVFIGPLGGPEFMNYVRSGVLWKDTFAPSHGEFSHSFQWFAAGVGLNLGARISDLYKKAGSVFSNPENMATRGTDGNLVRARQPLWAWLVDCFQPGTLESQIGDTSIDHVFSKSCRVPNQINSLAFNKKEWFISLYVDHRKQWLAKLAERGQAMRAEDNETDEPNSNLLGIMKYQKKAYPAKGAWQLDDTPHTNPQRTVDRSGQVFKKVATSPTTKGQVPVTYHQKPGTVSMLAITQKNLIT